jgi:ubiquinol-cytochrome c reductase iron-sulfur subunit
MASLSRSFASAIANRTYTNAPASATALKRVFALSSSNSEEEQHAPHSSQPLFNAPVKQRSAGGLVNKTSVNGKDPYRTDNKVENVDINFSIV